MYFLPLLHQHGFDTLWACSANSWLSVGLASHFALDTRLAKGEFLCLIKADFHSLSHARELFNRSLV